MRSWLMMRTRMTTKLMMRTRKTTRMTRMKMRMMEVMKQKMMEELMNKKVRMKKAFFRTSSTKPRIKKMTILSSLTSAWWVRVMTTRTCKTTSTVMMRR
jgi:hypothetical protein